LGCTARFGTDSKRSVLDVDCKAHTRTPSTSSMRASSRPRATVNPGLTTIAKALRVGDHPLEQLGEFPAASGEPNRTFVRADTQTLQPHVTALSESTR
jgi:hypothetical protein